MDYLKLFQTHEEYETFVSGGTMVRPNVSHCVSENGVHYNPNVETRIVAKFYTDTTTWVKLFSYNTDRDFIDKIEIDGVEGDTHFMMPKLSAGEHIVKYTLKNPSEIGRGAFQSCIKLVDIILPPSVTKISNGAFRSCLRLENINISPNITEIEDWAFCEENSLNAETIAKIVAINQSAISGCEEYEEYEEEEEE